MRELRSLEGGKQSQRQRGKRGDPREDRREMRNTGHVMKAKEVSEVQDDSGL